VEFWGLLLMGIPFLLVISYFAFQYVALSFSQNEQSESLTGIGNRYIIKSFLIIGFLLLLSSFIATILRLIVAIWGNEEDSALGYEALDIFAEQGIQEEIEEFKSDIEETKGH
jgi:TRAP-type mannitol/chloroaromatic compound transport system permease small subunit